MKKLLLTCIFPVLLLSAASAQNIKLNISLAHTTCTAYTYFVAGKSVRDESVNGHYVIASENNTRSASLSFNFTEPRLVSFHFDDGNDKSAGFDYNFFLSPGDDITFKADFKKPGNGIDVSGKGSTNNQPLLLNLTLIDTSPFYGDTTPVRVIAAINQAQQHNHELINRYITTYKPSAQFIRVLRYNLLYDAAENYFSFKENNKFQVEDRYKRNRAAWQHIQDSLFDATQLKRTGIATSHKSGASDPDDAVVVKKIPADRAVSLLNNDDALVSKNFQSLLRIFLLREKERLWNEADDHPADFFKQWYNVNPATGKKLFADDRYNLLQEKIVNRYFSGKTAEYMYAVLFNRATEEHDPKNIAAIFDHFKSLYPNSEYIGIYQPIIDTVIKRESQQLTEKMVFAADNGAKLNTLNEVLQLTKGKTVLVDMWGTWCGPCREEIDKNSASIKAYFKDKGLDYLYVANYDQDNEKNWKKLIAYFHLDGTHILANDALNKDIMAKVKGKGYPTYFIIKKDGSYELSKAGYPMNRDVLIKQLEAAMAE